MFLFRYLLMLIAFCCYVFCKEELKNNQIQRRIYELLTKAATSAPSHPSSGQRELHFVFFRKPDGFLESHEKSGHVSGVRLEKTVLLGTSLLKLCFNCFIDLANNVAFLT